MTVHAAIHVVVENQIALGEAVVIDALARLRNEGLTLVALQKAVEIWSRRVRRCWDRPPWWYLLLVAPWVIGATLSIYEWRDDCAIAQRQQTAPGTILTHEPTNHNRYGYSFTISGRPFNGWHIPIGNEEPTVGQRVTVYYDPVDPNISALVDFGELGRRSLDPVPLAIGGSGLVALFIFVRRRSSTVRTEDEEL